MNWLRLRMECRDTVSGVGRVWAEAHVCWIKCEHKWKDAEPSPLSRFPGPSNTAALGCYVGSHKFSSPACQLSKFGLCYILTQAARPSVSGSDGQGFHLDSMQSRFQRTQTVTYSLKTEVHTGVEAGLEWHGSRMTFRQSVTSHFLHLRPIEVPKPNRIVFVLKLTKRNSDLVNQEGTLKEELSASGTDAWGPVLVREDFLLLDVLRQNLKLHQTSSQCCNDGGCCSCSEIVGTLQLERRLVGVQVNLEEPFVCSFLAVCEHIAFCCRFFV